MHVGKTATALTVAMAMTGTVQAGMISPSGSIQYALSQGAALDYAPPLDDALREAGLVRSPDRRPAGLVLAAARSQDLPAPRNLSEVRMPQETMYQLARTVGESYATHSAVREAGLSRTEFVTLFTTLIQRESNFDPDARSPAGAQGLGQLMPGTARALGVDDAFSPHQNLDAAARYLVEMLGRFGKAEYALAAYNAGPGNVKKHGGIPPFSETRQYVSDILHNTTVRLR